MRPGLALLPLRLFLGATFVYAGVYKLSDAGFLHAGADTYIGDQLEGFADGTPGGWLLETFALPHPVVAGMGVAVLEIAIGLLAVAGRFTRPAALGGLALSVVLWLTASWHTIPYFLGSDIVFAFAWLPFVLAGAEGQPALDNHERAGPLTTRRTAILKALGFTAAATGALAGVSVVARGSVPAAPARRPAAGTVVAESGALAPGDAVSVSVDGVPAIVIRGSDGAVTAFDATCTHAGCEVGWRDGEIRCPCHHARFDPASGEPTRGPAREPLSALEVVERGGSIVVQQGAGRTAAG
jgi:thiosulfate dehydrogenase [quinone] large subunit